jgi:hypothetical protein
MAQKKEEKENITHIREEIETQKYNPIKYEINILHTIYYVSHYS